MLRLLHNVTFGHERSLHLRLAEQREALQDGVVQRALDLAPGGVQSFSLGLQVPFRVPRVGFRAERDHVALDLPGDYFWQKAHHALLEAGLVLTPA